MKPEKSDQIRILFVFAWLVVGGEETEVRLLARTLDPRKFRINVVACFRKPGMPEQTHRQLESLGIDVDTAPYHLSFEDTVDYLARKLASYDVIVSCQNVADIYPALERLKWRPPLIEHGGLVSEALAGPKHFTSRYVEVCRSIRDAAASKMHGREAHAIEIPSMVDLSEFAENRRAETRAALGVSADTLLVGWVGRLDAKKRVEDFVDAAALVHARRPDVRFVIVGGPDAFMPEYAETLRIRAGERPRYRSHLPRRPVRRAGAVAGDGPFCLAVARRRHAACDLRGRCGGLPVVATADNGSMQQIEDGVSGRFVPHETPSAVAIAIERLALDPSLRARLGSALRRKVETTYSAAVVTPQWETLFRTALAERQPAPEPALFASFVQGGFECSTHNLRDGRRLDLLEATHHAANAAGDYTQLARHNIRAVRDGLRWHLIETAPGRYDWSSFLPMLRAAHVTGTQVIWDLMHYGWPNDLDIWSPAFVDRFAAYAAAAARVVKSTSDGVPFYCPINEMSFHSWGGGDGNYLNPFARHRGFELKVQLARASIAAMRAILAVEARARFVHCEPLISIVSDPHRPHDRMHAEGARLAQFQACDMIAGRMWPQLGGAPELLDIVGVNYYFDNQWIHGGPPMAPDHPLHKPFRTLLAETHARYGRPMIVAETGTEGDGRAAWFNGISSHVMAARAAGIPVEGICLYPIIDHVGWDNGRDCPSGLMENRLRGGVRPVHQPLADAIDRFCRKHGLAAAPDQEQIRAAE